MMWGKEKILIGMVHLLPLPGSPRFHADLRKIFSAAVADARTLENSGADALIVENFGDVPYTPGKIPMESLITMAQVAYAVRQVTSIPMGINVQFNAWQEEITLAKSVGAEFIRLEAYVDNVLTDAGYVNACSGDATRYRRSTGAESIRFFTDVLVKETIPLGNRSIAEATKAACHNLADAVIVTGRATGSATPLDAIREARDVATRPLLVGSGVTLASLPVILPWVDGVIVGSALKYDGFVENRVDPERVRQIAEIVRTHNSE